MSGPSAEELIESFRKEIPLIVSDTVKQTLLQLGMDTSTPIEIQDDMRHLREWRKSVESIKNKSIWTVLSTLILGICGLILLGLQEWIHRTPPT